MSKGSSDDLEALLSSPDVAPFLSDDFHVASFTSTALRAGSSAVETVDRVASQIKRIDQAISAEVAENQSILVSNVRRSHVAEVQLQVRSVSSSRVQVALSLHGH